MYKDAGFPKRQNWDRIQDGASSYELGLETNFLVLSMVLSQNPGAQTVEQNRW